MIRGSFELEPYVSFSFYQGTTNMGYISISRDSLMKMSVIARSELIMLMLGLATKEEFVYERRNISYKISKVKL